MIVCVCLNPSVDMFVWLDHLYPAEVHRAKEEAKYPGGKGVHVALALRELGNEVALLGCWGGATGEWVKQQCKEQGISVHGPDLEGWTRSCMTIKSDSVFDETEILGVGPTGNDAAKQSILADYSRLLEQADLVSISGSLPHGIATDCYAEMVRVSQRMDVPVYIDFTGEPLKLALPERPYGVHLNRTEAQAITGKAGSHLASEALLAHCSLSCVTDGKNGAYIAVEGQRLHSYCPVEDGYSAVGSGDCLVAGLCHAYRNGYDAEETARIAAACGAANLLRPDLGMLYGEDVWALLKKTTVRRLQ